MAPSALGIVMSPSGPSATADGSGHRRAGRRYRPSVPTLPPEQVDEPPDVDVAARQDDTHAPPGEGTDLPGHGPAQQRGQRRRPRRLDDDAQPLEGEAHGVEDVVVGDGDEGVDAPAVD